MNGRGKGQGARVKVLAAFAVLAVGAVGAAFADVGTSSAEFLRLGAGAEVAQSEAGGSTASEAQSLAWNPAGLAGLKTADIYGAHRSLPEGISQEFLAGALPVAGGVLGYSLNALQSGSIPEIDASGNETGSFSATDMGHTVAYARTFGETRAGLGAELISQSIAGVSGTAFAASLGAQRDIGEDWTAGVAVSHLGSALKLASESYPLPMTVRAGAAYKGMSKLIVALDVTQSEGRGTRAHLGAAYRLWSATGDRGGISLRAGYTAGGEADADGPSGLAAGLGFSNGAFRADLAYQPFGELGAMTQLGAGWTFR